MAIHLITDSSSDISFAMRKLLGVESLPLFVNFEKERFLDGDLTPEELFAKMEAEPVLPKTSLVPPLTFRTAFERALEDGGEVIVILIASALSGTFQSACVARDQLREGRERVHVIDSETASMGLGLLMREAVKMRDNDYSAARIVREIEALKKRVRFYALIDNIRYLKQGGRLSAAAAMAANVLNIKPIVTLREGIITAPAKVRGLRNGYARLLAFMRESGVDHGRVLALGHTCCKERLKEMVRVITDGGIDLSLALTNDIGAVISIHGGPGCVGLSYFQPE